MRIGLFGGSFNPPHRGHLHVSEVALTRLNLDAIWWLVTPGNPLKDNRGLPPLQARLVAARTLADHPKMHVTDVEAVIGASTTAETLRWLTRRCPGVKFVWIMGADNLQNFHSWQRWAAIACLMPIAIIARPGAEKAPLAKAARILSSFRLSERQARTLIGMPPPAWVFLHAPLDRTSSSHLRAQAAKRAEQPGFKRNKPLEDALVGH